MALVGLLITNVAASCLGGEATPQNGCLGRASNAWVEAGLHAQVQTPHRCEYSVTKVEQDMPLSVFFGAPQNVYLGKHLTVGVSNRVGTPISQTINSTYVYDVICMPFPACQLIGGSFKGGTGVAGVNPYGTVYEDDINASSWVHVSNLPAGAQLWLTGRRGAVATILGPSGSLPASSPGVYSAGLLGGGDTLSFLYQWYLNGVAIAGATNRSVRPFIAESGVHQLRVIALLADQTTDTVTQSITIHMDAAINGTWALQAGEAGSWTATAAGARQPITCRFTVDGVLQRGSSCSYATSFASAPSAHTIGVVVTDARGIQAASQDYGITVSGPGNDQARQP